MLLKAWGGVGNRSVLQKGSYKGIVRYIDRHVGSSKFVECFLIYPITRALVFYSFFYRKVLVVGRFIQFEVLFEHKNTAV